MGHTVGSGRLRSMKATERLGAMSGTRKLTWVIMQRQTVMSQFYQVDRLVVEGGISVSTRHLAFAGTGLTLAALLGETKGVGRRRCETEGHRVSCLAPFLEYVSLDADPHAVAGTELPCKEFPGQQIKTRKRALTILLVARAECGPD